jgi:dTDP-4-amino-4,6-dideoxygalactose transaminase
MKNWTEFAILGGTPAFEQRLHVGRPNVGNKRHFLMQAEAILDRRWLTNQGPVVGELERRIEEYLGVKHCIAMCNGTVALEIAIRALEMDGEVIVPSYTFVATAHALHWQGVTPVFCDVDPQTHNIDPGQVERLITPRTTGILGVHLWGRPCAVERLTAIARRHGLRLLFDAAHAFGCSANGRMVGSFGHAEVFSFHATKFFNTLEGGAVVTNDSALAERIRLVQNFGFGPGYDNVVSTGTNGKMNEMCAAMGLTNLDAAAGFVEVNRENWELYSAGLADVPGVKVAGYNPAERNNYQYVIVEVDENAAGINRDGLVEVLQAENVLARRYFYPGCHRMAPYRWLYPEAGRRLRESERLSERVLALPTGTSMNAGRIEALCELVRTAVVNAPALRAAMAKRGMGTAGALEVVPRAAAGL